MRTFWPKVDGERLRQISRRALERAGGGSRPFKLTPVLPEDWPATAGTSLAQMAYQTRALATGKRLYLVQSPEYRIRFSPGQGAPTPEIERLPSRELEDRQAGGEGVPESDLDLAADALLRIVSGAEEPGDRDRLGAGYRLWARKHSVIAREVARSFPAFFSWLLKDEPPDE